MKCLLILLTCLVLNTNPQKEKTTTIYLIRQAEIDEGQIDPLLSPAGVVRTRAWAKFFRDKNISTYYTTNISRTRETAAYIADYSMSKEKRKTFPIVRYELWDLSLKLLAENHKGENLLVIGHKKTIPAFINALIGEVIYTDIPEVEFDYLYTIKIKGDKVSHSRIEM